MLRVVNYDHQYDIDSSTRVHSSIALVQGVSKKLIVISCSYIVEIVYKSAFIEYLYPHCLHPAFAAFFMIDPKPYCGAVPQISKHKV